jgi:hypothetical protein
MGFFLRGSSASPIWCIPRSCTERSRRFETSCYITTSIQAKMMAMWSA